MILQKDPSIIFKTMPNRICIPPKPELLKQISEEINKDATDAAKVADILCHDVALSAAILKIVNSPYFALQQKVQSISHAISLFGIDRTKNLVASFLFKKELSNNNKEFPRFWDSSANVADTCAFIATEWNVMPPDTPFTLGLFHDVGIPLMAAEYPDYMDVLKQANQSTDGVFTDIEASVYDIDHAIVASAVTNEWGITDSIRDIILYHHDVESFFYFDDSEGTVDSKLLAILKVAEYSVFFLKTGKVEADWHRYGKCVKQCLNVSDDDIEKLILKLREIIG